MAWLRGKLAALWDNDGALDTIFWLCFIAAVVLLLAHFGGII